MRLRHPGRPGCRYFHTPLLDWPLRRRAGAEAPFARYARVANLPIAKKIRLSRLPNRNRRKTRARRGARQAGGQLSVYGGAPTPDTVCVPHGVRSTMRAGALRSPTVSVAVRAWANVSSGSGCAADPNTVPCQW